MSGRPSCLLVVRIKGSVGISKENRDTLRMLNLHRTNWATLLYDTPAIKGMLRKVANYITWGEPRPEVLAMILAKRADPVAGVDLEEELRKLGIESMRQLAERVIEGEISIKDLRRFFKPYFRLHPPKGGFKRSVKRYYGDKGECGYRGEAINDLVARMI